MGIYWIISCAVEQAGVRVLKSRYTRNGLWKPIANNPQQICTLQRAVQKVLIEDIERNMEIQDKRRKVISDMIEINHIEVQEFINKSSKTCQKVGSSVRTKIISPRILKRSRQQRPDKKRSKRLEFTVECSKCKNKTNIYCP